MEITAVTRAGRHGGLIAYRNQVASRTELPILYRGHVITLTAADRIVLVHGGPGNLPPVRVGCGGQLPQLNPGQTLGFRLEQEAATPLASAE